MKYLVLILISVNAMAASTATYQVSGKEVNLSDAIKAATNGLPVMQCQNVVIVPNKTNTSFSLRKPKTSKLAKED